LTTRKKGRPKPPPSVLEPQPDREQEGPRLRHVRRRRRVVVLGSAERAALRVAGGKTELVPRARQVGRDHDVVADERLLVEGVSELCLEERSGGLVHRHLVVEREVEEVRRVELSRPPLAEEEGLGRWGTRVAGVAGELRGRDRDVGRLVAERER